MIKIILLIILLLACLPVYEAYVNYPYTISTRSTRNMTYDLRCVPKIKKHKYIWNYSVNEPQHYGKCLEMK